MELVRLKVLLVEDSPGDARLLAEQLRESREEPIDLTWASTLKEGMDRLEKERFDVVLLDLLLPDSFGMDTVDRFLEKHPTVAVVVLTALSDREMGLDAIASGAEDFLVKGEISPEALARTLRHATERRAAKAALLRREQELKRTNRQLERVAHVVSDELRQPLAEIVSELLLLSREHRSSLDDRALRVLDQALSAGRRMRGLLDSLHEYARLDTAGGPATDTDAGRALEQAVEALTPELVAAGGTVSKEELPKVHVDAQQLTLLFRHLLANALRFHGPEPPQVRVGAKRERDGWVFSVSDNGLGIDPQHGREIFDLFRTLHGRETPGAGMGLAIARRIVERHGGRIWVESAPGRGATFHFTMPAAQEPEETPEKGPAPDRSRVKGG